MKASDSTAQNTRAQILEAAEHLFVRFGFAKVTMEEIASGAGLGKASLYYYFPTKDDLFRAVVEPKHRIFEQRVQQILKNGHKPADQIEAYVDARFDFFKELLELNVIDIQSMTKGSPSLSAIFQRYARQELLWLRKLFKGGRTGDEFGFPPNAKVPETLLHVMQGLRLRFVREHQNTRPGFAAFAQLRREVRFVTRTFVVGLGNGSFDGGRERGETNRVQGDVYMKTQTKIVLLLVPVLIVALVYLRISGSESAGTARKQGAIIVKVDFPRRETMTQVLQLTGDVLPIQQAMVYSRVPGTLEKVLVNMGDHVRANQLLASIDTTELAQQYRQAQATYANDSILFERSKALLQQNLATQQDFDNAETAFKVARSTAQTAETQLQYSQIMAPFSGYVTRRFLDPGALVNSNNLTLFTVMDIDSIKLLVNVLEKDVPRIGVGTKAAITVDAYPGREFVGRIARIAQSLDLSTRTMPVEIDVPNTDLILKPGMFASVSLIVKEQDNALTVPTQALLKDTTGTFVFVASKGVARRTTVSPGVEQSSRTEILTGLDDKDSVITTGQQYIRDGGPINIQP